MSNTNPIAALIAAQTPIGTRYQLDPEPRHMGMCSNCHGDHHIQQCPEIARFDLTARLDEQSATIAALRLALDEAHQHVGALVASAEDIWDILAELITASIDNDRERGRAALDRVLDTGFDTSAARAWLRRA